jgi:enoyl-CoA hydratase
VSSLNEQIRVVVITAAGDDVFASGADMAELSRPDREGLGGDFGEAMEQALQAIERCPAVVIARIQGHALGAGYQLALACDLRVAVDYARLGVPASRFGLLPGHPHHLRMMRQLGVQVTRELMFTGRSFSGESARRRGLCDYQFPREELDPGIERLIDDIMAGAPITVRNSKRIIHLLLEAESQGRGIEGGLLAELTRLAGEAHTSEDVKEGLTAFFERRPPRFQGR